jgi:hypothetical protein
VPEDLRNTQPPHEVDPDSPPGYNTWPTVDAAAAPRPAVGARPGLRRSLWETFSRPSLAVFDWAVMGAGIGRTWVLVLLGCIPAGAGSATLVLLSRDQVLKAQQQMLTSFGVTTLTAQTQQTLLVLDAVILAIVAMVVAALHYLCLWGVFRLVFRNLPRRPARETAYLLALAFVPGSVAAAFALVDTFFVGNATTGASANITIGLSLTALALELYRFILTTQALRSAVLTRNARITAAIWMTTLLVGLPFLLFLSTVGG